MRKAIVLLMVVGVITLLNQNIFAQQSLFGGCSSAGVVNNPVWFNCDREIDPGTSVYLNYRGQSQTSFTTATMTPVVQPPFYQNTHETNVTFGSSQGVLEYYFYTRLDTFMTTQSPKNSDNQFPPAAYKYAHFIPDASGDMVGGSAGNWLDITANGMTYSDTRIYGYLQSVSGTYPQSQLITYFAYTMGFLITSGTDSAYYAMVYANVPLLLSSGLYILDRSDSSYTRIGDISYTINSGILHMACNLSTFASDPNWPGWPPPDGYIMPMAATLTAGLTEQYVNDYSHTPTYEPKTQYLDFNSNNPPGLFSNAAIIDSGVGITLGARYLDLNNNLPTVRRLHFDSDILVLGSADHIYSDSSEFVSTLGWPSAGWHRYYFEFSDGKDTVETTPDSIPIEISGCDYLQGDFNGDGQRIGGDVTYGVRYFKGTGSRPPDSCANDSVHTTRDNWLYVSVDVNGDCNHSGADITRLVAYFKGYAQLSYCRFFPPPPMREVNKRAISIGK